jgi:hypothetical protein
MNVSMTLRALVPGGRLLAVGRTDLDDRLRLAAAACGDRGARRARVVSGSAACAVAADRGDDRRAESSQQ